jgi:ABC-type bacteriocin/lantibiotic exporter with double-glycine peptidase domain
VTQTRKTSDQFNVHTGPNNTNFFNGIHFHGERLTSITLIKDEEIADQEKVSLSHEFYRGISARYEHILAAVDQPRLIKLKVIAQKFREYRVVIVHGASGQGKTTLGSTGSPVIRVHI